MMWQIPSFLKSKKKCTRSSRGCSWPPRLEGKLMTHSRVVVYRKSDGKIINFIDHVSVHERSDVQTPVDLESISTEIKEKR